MNPDNKRELQFKRERDAVADSVDKFHKGLKTAPEHSRPGSALLQEYWKSLADAISGEQRNLKQTSHSAKYAILMLGIEANSLAVITLQSIIWARGFDEAEDDDETAENEADDENEAQAAQVKKKEAKLTRLTKEIARRSRYHWWRMTEAAKNEALGRCTEKYSAKIQNRERRKAAEILNGDWSRQARDIPFGARLLELATEAGIITITREFAGKNNNPYVVEFTDKFKQSLEKSKAHYEELLGPIYRPMVCEPVKWVGPEGGGYLENEDSKEIHLVKHRKDQRLIRAFEKGDMERTIMAVNALQETRWRINAPIYDVMFQVYMKAKDKEDGKLRSQLHKKEREKQENDIKKMERALAVCADIKDEEVIFFPYQLDYRGRVYCLPTVVHPQADDIGRSLLEFSDGEPLGKRGAHWLKVHLANCYGKDKVSYEERVEWVDANEEMILLSAEDPLNNLEWIQPKGSRENEMAWRFLAACFEWRQYKTKGASFFSHLPIIMDGTCNGLQHLSALRRDETGAKETNLLPNDQPRDIYKTVADDLKGVLEKDRDKGITAAADCLKMEINREMCKKAVMTTPYGITRRGIHKQLLVEEFTEPFVDQRWKNCYYLAGKMIECIGDIVDRGNIMRNWLQKIAIDLARANSGVSWVAPSGFPVIQETWKQKGMRVKAGKYSLVIKEPIDPPKMDSVAQKQKMVANFIHSLDAAHLVLTVNRMYSEGQRAFCVIHDGFGVHCCNVDALHVALREEFIGIYEGNVITRFSLDQAFNPLETGYLPVELPQNLFAPPDVGTFDIQKIRNSDYFFC